MLVAMILRLRREKLMGTWGLILYEKGCLGSWGSRFFAWVCFVINEGGFPTCDHLGEVSVETVSPNLLESSLLAELDFSSS